MADKTETTWRYDDGGRSEAGYRGLTGDCAVRSAAIVSGRPYQEVYDLVNKLAQRERPQGRKKRSSAREGVHTVTMRRLMKELGLEWNPIMGVGTGTTVHLLASELPKGRLVVRLSRHFAAVIDGVIHDTYDPAREGTRAVYGYWA